jgi:flagellar L-ring protein precursor FlgH
MKYAAFFLILLTLNGCASILNPPPRRDPAYAPARPEDMTPPMQNPGAIFQSGYDMRLFEDHKARRVGDTLTIKLVERTNAQKDADTKADRSATTQVKAPMLMGQEAAEILGYNVSSSLESTHKFEGKGESNQGNLRVRGEKRVGLNQGNEYIKLSGLVRPVDIDTTNSVDSTKVADATFIYNGEGVVADVNRMGWLQRFFTSILFPF